MTAVTCDFDFFMFPLLHKISNFVLFLLVTHYLLLTFELITHTHTHTHFGALFDAIPAVISAVECAAITIYVQVVN